MKADESIYRYCIESLIFKNLFYPFSHKFKTLIHISSENLVVHQDNVTQLIISFILMTCLLDNVWYGNENYRVNFQWLPNGTVPIMNGIFLLYDAMISRDFHFFQQTFVGKECVMRQKNQCLRRGLRWMSLNIILMFFQHTCNFGSQSF